MSAAQRGFIMIALAFPIYLLWKGRLTAYLALVSNAQPVTANQGTIPTFGTVPTAGTGLGSGVLGLPGSGSGAAGGIIPIPGL